MATHPNKGRQFGWFGLLMIAIVSGLIVKVVGDPLVQILTPQLEDTADDLEDWLEDQEWEEKLEEQLKNLSESQD